MEGEVINCRTNPVSLPYSRLSTLWPQLTFPVFLHFALSYSNGPVVTQHSLGFTIPVHLFPAFPPPASTPPQRWPEHHLQRSNSYSPCKAFVHFIFSEGPQAASFVHLALLLYRWPCYSVEVSGGGIDPTKQNRLFFDSLPAPPFPFEAFYLHVLNSFRKEIPGFLSCVFLSCFFMVLMPPEVVRTMKPS